MSTESTRTVSPALEAILGQRFNVLDDGFVRVLDYMGDDRAVVQAARVSYGSGTKAIHQDKGLIRYLMRHRHTTPFEMCELKLHVRAPMDVWRQWIRHRTASINEYSTRYSVAIDKAHRTAPDKWRLQSKRNRQGSGEYLSAAKGEVLSKSEEELQLLARSTYDERLGQGIAREQARKDLPLSTYTEAYWKIDLHNLFGFLELRMDSHAQHEIREYATIVGHSIVKRWVPHSWEAFEDYRLNAVRLSAAEASIVRAMSVGALDEATQLAEAHGVITRNEDGGLATGRERSEIEDKLTSLGFAPPWIPKPGPHATE